MIYECLLERAYEGVSETFCTSDEKVAFEWSNNHCDDFGTIKIWKDGEVIKCINYEFNFDKKSWIRICE